MTIEESKRKLDDANSQALKNALDLQTREILINSDNSKVNLNLLAENEQLKKKIKHLEADNTSFYKENCKYNKMIHNLLEQLNDLKVRLNKSESKAKK